MRGHTLLAEPFSGLGAAALRFLALMLVLALGTLSARADSAAPHVDSAADTSSVSDSTLGVLSGAIACESAIEESGSAGSKCLQGQMLNQVVLPQLMRFASERGRTFFGEHFRISSRLTWSPGGTGFSGDIDAVFPVSFSAAREAMDYGPNTERGAQFLQWGATRWVDEHGKRHHDLRIGAVRRFSLSDAANSDILGLSVLYQQSAESGHARFVSGIDYAGTWGSGWFHHYSPISGWRPGRLGFEERPLAGMELGLRLNPTSTIALTTAFTRWEHEHDSRRWSTGARIGLDWRPHAWLSFRTAWRDIGTGHDAASLSMTFSLPLGGNERGIPRWEGLGIATRSSSSETNSPDPWRPIENVGRIRVAERTVTAPLSRKQGADTPPHFTGGRLAAQTFTVGSAVRTLTLPAATGGNGAKVYRLTPSVPGLYFNPRLRRLTGTPTRAGIYRMTYRVTDSDANLHASDSDTRSFTITVQAAGDFAPRFTARVAAQTFTVGSAIRTLTLPVATGGNGARIYRLTPNVPGLSFDARLRRLTGTPIRAGTYRMTYRVTDSDANTRASDSHGRVFVITVQAAGDFAPQFTDGVAAQTFTVGSAIRALTLPAANGGNGARIYRLTPSVPGLYFNPRLRRLTGTPTRAGTYRMTYRVTDSDANTRASDSHTRKLTITVQARGDFPPRFTQGVDPQTFTVGSAIRTLTLPAATGGNGARIYRLTPNVPGLSFDARLRRLTGTPTRAGTYRMTYRVTDSDANTRASDSHTRKFTITVQTRSQGFPPVFPPRSPPQASGVDLSRIQVAGAGTTTYVWVSNDRSTPITYREGSWIEPKDGSYQRMMVTRTVRVPGGQVARLPTACMQISKSIPATGLRFFSSPKTPFGAVQDCQRQCLGGGAVQSCVWNCENRPPVARGTVSNRTLTAGTSDTLDLSRFFSDPDDPSLTYTSRTTNSGVVTTSVSGATLTLRAVNTGTATITVTATDSRGQSARQQFTVRVEADPNVRPIRDFPITVSSSCPTEVAVCVRDHECEDGDQVRVSVNNSVIFSGEIFNQWQCRTVPVRVGTNSVEMFAINGTGRKGPCSYADINTGEIRVSGSGGNVQTQSWRHRGGAGSRANLVVSVGPPTGNCSLPGSTGNRPPVTRGNISSRTLNQGSTSTLSVSAYFSDPDGDNLRYTAQSSNSGVATASVSGATLTLRGISAGNTTIRVTATDPGGLRAQQDFTVTVQAVVTRLYGAVAGSLYSNCEDRAVGMAWNYSDEASAKSSALQSCQSRLAPGQPACSNWATFGSAYSGDNQCAAVAYGTRTVGSSTWCKIRVRTGGTESTAQSNALSECRSGGFICSLERADSGGYLSACAE